MKPTISQVREALKGCANARGPLTTGSKNMLRSLAASLEDMVLVPREPTTEMIGAAIQAMEQGRTIGRIYAAMLKEAE